MSVYMIIDSKVKDGDKYRQYIDQVSSIVIKYGGRYHVRGGGNQIPWHLETREDNSY